MKLCISDVIVILNQNLKGEIEKVANFLGKAPSEEQLTRLTNHLRLDTFKTNEAVNHEKYKKMGIMEDKGNFIRKGCISLLFFKNEETGRYNNVSFYRQNW